MPELPEVETVIRSLCPLIQGLKIQSSDLLFGPILRNADNSILRELEGRVILGLRRRGKMILIDCAGNRSLLIHLKMTGQLFVTSRREPVDKHTHFILRFKGHGRELRFRDVRKFGFVRCLGTSEADGCSELAGLGPEPLELDFRSFQSLLRGRRGRLKPLLLNQKVIAGIGNIYADEILYRARLNPRAPVQSLRVKEIRRLWLAMRRILREAITLRGSSIRDFIDSQRKEGEYQDRHLAYGREAEPCTRCGRKITRIRLAGRSTYFCPRCQR